MPDVEQQSLSYFMSRPEQGRWAGLLRALADELSSQMSAAEIRAFFVVLGRRWARAMPLSIADRRDSGLSDFERAANAVLAPCDWGWVRVRDLGSIVELEHSCAPLRSAFGAEALPWSTGLLEGLYAGWMQALGADGDLVLRQVGGAEGAADTLRFRLAAASSQPAA